MSEDIAGRSYPRVYRTVGREGIHGFLQQAVQASGGRVLYASSPSQAPIYLGVQGSHDERVGLLIYPFTANRRVTVNRPVDEHRFQIRYGGEESWRDDHPLGRDVAQVDTTLLLGVHVERHLLIGLDPALYDPLPMGISFEFKEKEVAEASRDGWYVYERVTRQGQRRGPRAAERLETVVIFRPERLLDYARLEREASDLALDPPLRYIAAQAVPSAPSNQQGAVGSLHHLERQFGMSSVDILDVISNRTRLAVAVRGGVAEFHLERRLRDDPAVTHVESLDLDGQPDFRIRLVDNSRDVTIECKNASPKRYENGDYRVEVQKTRASKNDPASRYYHVDQFDVVAACLYAPTKRWEFVFKATHRLARHPDYPDRVAPMQRVDATWCQDLQDATAPS
jgi:restriction-modification system family protein